MSCFSCSSNLLQEMQKYFLSLHNTPPPPPLPFFLSPALLVHISFIPVLNSPLRMRFLRNCDTQRMINYLVVVVCFVPLYGIRLRGLIFNFCIIDSTYYATSSSAHMSYNTVKHTIDHDHMNYCWPAKYY